MSGKHTTVITIRQARIFGLTMGAAFGVVAAFFFWKHPAAAPYAAGIGALFLILAAVYPRALRPVERMWMAFALRLGVVVTTIILVLTFYLVITPMGLVAKLLGKDLMALKFDASRESYWNSVSADGPGTRPDKPY